MSKVIHNPALAAINENSDVSAEFVIEPLHAGYGNTLGNSLRRVLLSSIKGGAIVAFRIEGATHEFTTVPGIKEDVVDIMLNLKNVHMKVHTDEPIELRLEKKAPVLSPLLISKHLRKSRLLTLIRSSQQLTIPRNQFLSTLLLNLVAATVPSRTAAAHVFTAI